MHDLYSLLSGLAKPERRKHANSFSCFARPSERDTVLGELDGWLRGRGGVALQVDPSNYALGQRAALGRRQRMESIT